MVFPLVHEIAQPGAPIMVPVSVTCKVLGFSRQTYYTWLQRPESARETADAETTALLRTLHADAEGGYRVLHGDLLDLGHEASSRRVWRVCNRAGIKSTIVTCKQCYQRAGAPMHDDDEVQRNFTASAPNVLWLTGITEHRTVAGTLCMCAVKDVFSNRIVGYSIDSRMNQPHTPNRQVELTADCKQRRGARKSDTRDFEPRSYVKFR